MAESPNLDELEEKIKAEIISNEKDLGIDVEERATTANAALDQEQTRLEGLEKRWETERE